MKSKSFFALAIFILVGLAGPRAARGGEASTSPGQGSGERKIGRPPAQAGAPSGPSLKRDSGSARSPIRDPAVRKDVRGPKVIVVDDRDSSITVQQTQQQTVPAETKAAPKKKTYRPARWVRTEHGVEVLEHGRWVEVGVEKEY